MTPVHGPLPVVCRDVRLVPPAHVAQRALEGLDRRRFARTRERAGPCRVVRARSHRPRRVEHRRRYGQGSIHATVASPEAARVPASRPTAGRSSTCRNPGRSTSRPACPAASTVTRPRPDRSRRRQPACRVRGSSMSKPVRTRARRIDSIPGREKRRTSCGRAARATDTRRFRTRPSTARRRVASHDRGSLR